MIKKEAGTNGWADVTFIIYPQVGTQKAAVPGEWNHWSHGYVMYPLARGGFSRRVRLAAGNPADTYQFRYLLDGRCWENDPDADGYVGENSVVDLTDPALGNGPDLPGNLTELAAASAADFTGSAGNRIAFLSTARDLLQAAEAPAGGGVSAELVPPITTVVLDVLDFIDRDLQPTDLGTLTDLKQQLADLLQKAVPAVQTGPGLLIHALRPLGR